ncbi:MAG: polysaccharide pyruvyl transferase family protein [Proteobacteria bacterium]|nr:polysaccharide pyruvyl transferase family protein [Pseudomonadota bacterium]
MFEFLRYCRGVRNRDPHWKIMDRLPSNMRTDMRRFLDQFSGENVLFVPNAGNAGDCLIFASTLSAMSRSSVNFEIADDGADFKNRTVFLGGGGNLVGIYPDTCQTIEACRSEAARIVLLPHTIRGNDELIASLDGRFTIWCRERRSFEHVRKLNPDLDCHIGHDMAFHCDVEEFLSDLECNEIGTLLLNDGLKRRGTSLERLAELSVVRFMRTDREARSSRIATDLDVSLAFGSVADVETSTLTAWCFLKTISVAKRVITDRLHVAIACALLGTTCELLDNSYSKNREVYAHSLHRFDGISFKRSAGARIADQPPRKKSLFAKTANRAHRLARDFLRRGAMP